MECKSALVVPSSIMVHMVQRRLPMASPFVQILLQTEVMIMLTSPALLKLGCGCHHIHPVVQLPGERGCGRLGSVCGVGCVETPNGEDVVAGRVHTVGQVSGGCEKGQVTGIAGASRVHETVTKRVVRGEAIDDTCALVSDDGIAEGAGERRGEISQSVPLRDAAVAVLDQALSRSCDALDGVVAPGVHCERDLATDYLQVGRRIKTCHSEHVLGDEG